MKPSSLVSLGVGYAVGDNVASSLDGEGIEKLATGFVAGGIASSVTSSLMKETGIDELIDEVFDIF